MSEGVKVCLTRPCLVGGEPQPVGARLTLPPLTALALVESAKAVFHDDAGRAAALDARRRDVAAQLRKAAQPAVQVQADGPWRHV